jgi:putative salt-induced outer membrane protein
MIRSTLALALISLLPMSVLADDAGGSLKMPEGWSGKGELGFASTHGNSRSESLNARVGFDYKSDAWTHRFSLAGVRARNEVSADRDGDGVPETDLELSANRYQVGASSARRTTEYAYWIGALRYEQDDFAAFEWQQTAALGYGYEFFHEREDLSLSTEIGPGLRRAKDRASGEIENGVIGRAKIDYAQRLTDNTDLVNTLLVEAGSDNTFAQNDLGLVVAMNSSLALKAGVQLRHNTEVPAGVKRTDTLTTVNLVYKLN